MKSYKPISKIFIIYLNIIMSPPTPYNNKKPKFGSHKGQSIAKVSNSIINLLLVLIYYY